MWSNFDVIAKALSTAIPDKLLVIFLYQPGGILIITLIWSIFVLALLAIFDTHLWRNMQSWYTQTTSAVTETTNNRQRIDEEASPNAVITKGASPNEIVIDGSTDKDQLERAKAYPYYRLNSSFIFSGGDAYAIDKADWKGPEKLEEMLRPLAPNAEIDFSPYKDIKWYAVLAIGSNASPEQLARKYTDPSVIIPVAQCVMNDFDVVFSPTITSYGSSPATLQYSPGAVVEQYLTYLTRDQLQEMIRTEIGYLLIDLLKIDLKIGLSIDQYREGQQPFQTVDHILTFNFGDGCLALPGRILHTGTIQYTKFSQRLSTVNPSPVAFQVIASIHRHFPEYTEVEMLKTIKDMMGEDRMDLDTWILRNVNDEDERNRVIEFLKTMAAPFAYDDYIIIPKIDDIPPKEVD